MRSLLLSLFICVHFVLIPQSILSLNSISSGIFNNACVNLCATIEKRTIADFPFLGFIKHTVEPFQGEDDCANTSLSILMNSVSDAGTTLGQSDEGATIAPPLGISAPWVDVWYEFTVVAPNNRLRILFDNMANTNTLVAIYNNCTGSNEQILFSNGLGNQCISVTPGTYKVRIINDLANAGPFGITLFQSNLANDDCSNPITVSSGTNANLTNICSSQDLTPCIGNANEASVWYEYTVAPGISTLNLVSDLPNSVIQVYENDCITPLMDVNNSCTNSVTIDCPLPQNIKIFVSSPEANTGIFSLTITESIQTGNDLCNMGESLTLTEPLCKNPNMFNGDNTGFCPEPTSFNFGGCDFSQGPATWYRFTTNASTNFLDVTISGLGVDFGLFTSCAGTPLAGSCTNDGTLEDIVVTPNTAYFLLVAGQLGFEGPFTIEITEKSILPTNDLCTNPTVINQGNNNGLTNLCASADVVACGGDSDEASVWYSFTVPSGVVSLEISTSLVGGAIQIYEDDCATLLTDVSGSCSSQIIIDCPVPQQIRVFVSSSTANAGPFNIIVSQINTTAPNDLCINAQPIQDNPICDFLTTTPITTIGSCPEEFTVPGCGFDYSSESVVWYSFTPPLPNTVSIEIENISASTNLTVFESCPNPGPGLIPAGGSCLSGNGTNGTPILVNAGVTYYIAIGTQGSQGNVNFDIRYNQFIPNDNPCLPNFTSVSLSNAVPLNNQDNNCATEDNTCGGSPITNSLWYSFTLDPGFDRISILVTGLTSPSIAIYDALNPCNQVVINEECNGDGTVEFNCLPPGTYQIMVGTSAVNANTYSITATQGNNAGPVNDFCTDASQIVIGSADLCVSLPFTSSTINACPETLPPGEIFGACNFNAEETSWYTFTAPGIAGQQPTMDFTYTAYSGSGTPFMNVFEFGPDCSALNALTNQCFDGLNDVFGNIGPLVPGQQYLIAISSYGDTGGNFDFNVKFNIGPANDDKCADLTAFDLGLGGTLTDQFNLCAGGDYTIPDCTPDQSENSVWYQFTVDPGSYGINLLIDQVMTNGTPLMGPITAGIFEDGCNSNLITSQLCFPAKVNQVIECLQPGTYDLQIATSSITAGDFLITISQLVDDRMCPAGSYDPNLGDECDEAIFINMAGITCEYIPINGCNTNACPETFNSGACNFDTDPTVWYQFTVDAGSSSIDIMDMTPGFSYAILTSTACSNPTALGGFECITNSTTMGIPVTGGETYFLIISNPTEGTFSYNIRQNVLPSNDDPDPASPRPPFALVLNGDHTSTTCCAVGSNDSPTGDVPNVACPSASNDDAVWYTYTAGTEQGITIQIAPSGSNPIANNTTIEVLQGTAAGPSTSLFNPTSFTCSGMPANIEINCYAPGDVIWIKVATSESDCGDFTIFINPLVRCDLAENCVDVTTTIMPNPTDPNCGSFVPVIVPGCLELACPETIITDCGASTLPTVWFQIEVDADAVQLGTTVESNGSWDPVWSIYSGMCDDLTQVGTVPCSNSDANPLVHSVGVLPGVTTYWIAVSGDGVIDDPTFTISVWTSANCVSCIGDEGCSPTAVWGIFERSSDRPSQDPFFCPGEEVRICTRFNYDASETGDDWLQGLFPDFGPGWDLNVFNPDDITVNTPDLPEWIAENAPLCASTITEQMPYLCTYTDPFTGKLKLCHTGCQTCPCSPPLLPGSPMPDGWFWNSPGGDRCENDCRPSTQFGIGESVVTILLCVNLKVQEYVDFNDCKAKESLRFNFITTSDGVTGCYEDLIAECKLDFAQIGPDWKVDCVLPPRINASDKDLCYEGFVNTLLTTVTPDPNVSIIVEQIPNPDVTGAMDHEFFGGSGTLNDFLTNTSSSVTVQQYIIYADDPNLYCKNKPDTLNVTIYPDLIVTIPDINICFEDPDGVVIEPMVVGGSGNYVSYNWSNGATTTTVIATQSGPNNYRVTVTDDKGCTGTQSVDVNKLDPLSFTVTPQDLTTCANEAVFETTNIIGNGSPLIISWVYPPQLYATDQNGSLVIDIPFSNPEFTPYSITVTLTDQYGCNISKDVTLDILNAPSVEIGFIQPPCGATSADILIQDYLSESGLPPTFSLVDCSGGLVYAMNGTGPAYQTTDPNGIFEDVDLSLINCFRILVEEDGGCTYLTEELVIPLTSGTQVLLSPPTSICLGQSATISVTNSGSFPNGVYQWSPTGSGNSITVSPSQTTQYSVTVTNNGCVSVASVLITVNPLPIPGISGATSFCPGENTQLTATGGTAYVWSGPNGFSAPNANTGPISTPGVYTVTVTNSNNCTAVASSTITEELFITVQISPVSICDNSLDSLNAGSGFDTYQWFDSNNIPLGSGQFQQVTLPGSYTVEVTNGACEGGGTGIVTNYISPSLNLPSSVDVCRVNTGIGPISIDFVSLGDTMNGQWFNIDNATVNTSNWGNVDFTSVASAGIFRFVFTTDTAVDPCVNVSDTVLVNVLNCACPNPAIRSIGPLCNSSNTPYNLNNTFLNQTPPIAGDWTVVAPSPTPFPTITGNNISVNGVIPGTYTLRFTYNPPSPGNCPKFIENTLVVSPAPSVSTRNISLCNEDIGSGGTMANLDTLLIGLMEPSPGSWTQIDGAIPIGTLPNIDVTGMARDTLRFQYTTTAIAPCLPRTAIVEMIIRNCACPLVILANDELCNGSMTLLDLEDPTRFTIDPNNITGTWTAQAPLTITNGNFINPFGIAASPTPYLITFELTGNFPPDCQTIFNKTIRIRNQPLAEKLNDGEACSAQTGNGATDLRLTSLLQPGYTTNGTWTQISPTAPLLTIPASSIVDFVGQVPGTSFVFRYTPPITLPSPCLPVSVEVTVTVKDCNCPDTAIDCLASDCDLCNDAGILDLNTTIVNPTSIAPGDFSVTGPGNVNIPLTSNILDATGLPEGLYRVRYTLNPPSSGACPRFSEFTLNIIAKKEVNLIADSLLCNGDNGIKTFDLSGLIASGSTGQWKDADGNIIASIINIEGFAPGFVLNFTYEIDNELPCQNSTYPVTIRITDNCNCTDIELGDIDPLCSNLNNIDLNAFSDPNQAGTWSALNPTLIIINGILNLNNVTAGMYDLLYSVTNPEPGCPSTLIKPITVFNPKSAGTARGAEFCLGATDEVILGDRLDNEDLGGIWTVVTGGNTGFDPAGRFDLTGRPAGIYVFRYSFMTPQSPCPDDDEEVTIRINPLPIADAGTDKNIDCTVQSAILGTDLSTSGPNIVYEWKLLNDVVGTNKNYTALNGGNYVLTVRDTLTNCSSSDNVVVIQADDLPTFTINVDSIKCFGETASILVSNIIGGQAPYEISFDGGITYGTALAASNLMVGSYKVLVRDANGCVNDQKDSIIITSPPLLAVNLGQDFSININRDSLLSIEGQYNVNDIESINWTANNIEIDTARDKGSINAKPELDTKYTVSVISKNGCIATDDINITIRRVKPECVPNIFSPNQNNTNEFFSINCADIALVTKYSIYDRWGNLLFVGENLSPDNTSAFWDGTFKSKPVVPGVYVYYMELVFKDGSSEKRGGDLTLIR